MRCKALGMAILLIVTAGFLAASPARADVCDNRINAYLLTAADSPLGVPPQVLLASTPEELRQIVESLGIPMPGAIDGLSFYRIKVMVIVGESRTNGCRSTEYRCVIPGSDANSAQAVIKETYAGCGCSCTMNYRGNAVFFVAVPSAITTASLLTEQYRYNCSACLPCPIGPVKRSSGNNLTVGQICN